MNWSVHQYQTPRMGAPKRIPVQGNEGWLAGSHISKKAGSLAALSAPTPPKRTRAEMVTATAIDEDVDVIGLSMLSGAHMALAPRVVDLLREQDAPIPVVVGGIIPEQDVDRLLQAGVASVLHPGASADEVAAAVEQAASTSD